MLSATGDGKWLGYIYRTRSSGDLEVGDTGELQLKNACIVKHDGLLFASAGMSTLTMQRDRCEIVVNTDSNGDVTITLRVTEDCDTQGAIFTDDDRLLSTACRLAPSGGEWRIGRSQPGTWRRVAYCGFAKARCWGFRLQVSPEYRNGAP